jgi:shikimate dehydrogenase
MSKVYGLIGFPLGHSFSQVYHNKRFAQMGIDARYEMFEMPSVDNLREMVAQHTSLMGLNVTIPHQERVIAQLDALDDSAREIGAVNVIDIERTDTSVRMVGYNTDYVGFRDSIKPMLQPHHTHALVLGTGGASKAVVVALKHLGVEVCSVSRTPANGQLGYEDLTPEVIARHTIIVNTTPLGMYPHVDACAPIPYQWLTPQHLCYDVVYNPEETTFMRRSAGQGATVCNGLKMLYGQADAAWEIWNRNKKEL